MVGEACGVAGDLTLANRRRSGYLVVATAGLFEGPRCWWHRLLRCAERRLAQIRSWDADAIIVPLPINFLEGVESATTADPGVFEGSLAWSPSRRGLCCGDCLK